MIEAEIGVRVKALRERAGMGQEELAAILGLENRQSVSDLERGKRRLTADELVTIIDRFNVTIDQLTNPFLLSARDSFSWRQRDVPIAELDRFEARAGEWIGAYRELNRLNETRLQTLLPRLGLTHTSQFEDASAAGEGVAADLNLGERPAIKLAETLERRLGILVLMVDAIEGISGAACRLRSLNAILINRHESQARRNSDLAHEFFHILTWEQMKPERVESDAEPWDRAPRTSSRSQQRNLRIEQLAENFTSGITMPSWELDRLGEPHGNVVQWLTAAAAELGVSSIALKWRLVNTKRRPDLEMIPNDVLLDAARLQTFAETPAPFGRSFIATIVKAIDSGHLSAARAARLTGMSRSSLGELCAWYGLDRPIEL